MPRINPALANDIDISKVRDVDARVITNSNEVDDIVDALVQKYCTTLDEYMRVIDNILTDDTQDVSDQELDMFTLNLPSILYFTTAAQESLGIKEDVAKAIKEDVYNRVRDKSQGTVADKDTAAELQSQAEAIVHIAYSRAYKKVKARVEAAYEMLNSIKKVITHRIAVAELSSADKGSDWK